MEKMINVNSPFFERDELGRFVQVISTEEVKMVDIQGIINDRAREGYLNAFRRAHTGRNIQNKEQTLKRLSVEVKRELEQQNNNIKQIQSDLMALATDEERKKAIMQVEDSKIRTRMIANNSELFTIKPADNRSEPVWDEQAGMYLTDEQKKKAKRKIIMDIKDTRERQKVISENLDLFN